MPKPPNSSSRPPRHHKRPQHGNKPARPTPPPPAELSPTAITPPAAVLAAAAKAFEQKFVIPHCTSCSSPCCHLQHAPLELSWPTFSQLYQIKSKKQDFDTSLDDGTGPAHIRRMDDLYYPFGVPCPAYSEEKKLCSVYQTDLKPQHCSDFPIYEDGGMITADFRCEALDIDDVIDFMQERFGENSELIVSSDPQFAFMVQIEVGLLPTSKPAESASKPSKSKSE